MRKFQDEFGRTWVASVIEKPGSDYKGRYWLVIAPEGAGREEEMELADVRWNSARTAARTLQTMSNAEIDRRHRSARGRRA